jgi:hypothetical protein
MGKPIFLPNLGLIIIILSGLYVLFISQASSPDYAKLFWGLLPIAAAQLLVTIIYTVFVGRRRYQIMAILMATVSAIAFLELTFRVWR